MPLSATTIWVPAFGLDTHPGLIPAYLGGIATHIWALAVGANCFRYEQNYLWGDFAATAVLSGLPITILFLALACQRLLVSSLASGGVKKCA